MKLDKKILHNLTNLESKKAQKFLEEAADALNKIIVDSGDNDFIYDQLVLLDEFAFRVPTQSLKICKFIFYKDNPNEPKMIERGKFGSYKGKDHVSLILKCMEIIDKNRYFETITNLQILSDLYAMNPKKIKEKALEVYKNIAGYNYFAIKNIGYLPQDRILDFLGSGEIDLEILKTITNELLDPSFEGTEMKDEKTFSWMFGALPVNDNLKKIRKVTIDLLISRLNLEQNIENKKAIINILDQATRFPSQGKYGEDFITMVEDDIKYLTKKYRPFIFDKEGSLILDFTLVHEIESQLFLRDHSQREKAVEANELLKQVKNDSGYKIFRLLCIGILDYKDEDDWRVAEEKRKKKIAKLFTNLSQDNISKFVDIFGSFAQYYNPSENWEWAEFRELMRRIGEKKPALAIKIIEGCIDSAPDFIENFSADLLAGFRKVGNFELWEKYSNILILKHNLKLAVQVFDSYWGINRELMDEQVRMQDIDLLGDAIEGKGTFSALKLIKIDDRAVHHSLMNALICIYNKDPQKIKKLILVEMANHLGLMDLFIGAIEIGIIRNEISFDDWLDEEFVYMGNYLIEVNSIDHYASDILVNFSFDRIMDILSSRIKKKIKISKTKHTTEEYMSYDAIPSYFDQDLIKKIQGNSNFKSVLRDWIDKVDNDYYYNIMMAELVQKVGGTAYGEIQEELLEKGKDEDLKKVTELMWGVSSAANIDVCFKIAGKTSNKEILDKLCSRMFTTGVVSGEYGIYNAHKFTKEAIEKIKKSEKDNKKIQTFANRMIKYLSTHMENEKARVEKELARRKIEFDS